MAPLFPFSLFRGYSPISLDYESAEFWGKSATCFLLFFFFSSLFPFSFFLFYFSATGQRWAKSDVINGDALRRKRIKMVGPAPRWAFLLLPLSPLTTFAGIRTGSGKSPGRSCRKEIQRPLVFFFLRPLFFFPSPRGGGACRFRTKKNGSNNASRSRRSRERTHLPFPFLSFFFFPFFLPLPPIVVKGRPRGDLLQETTPPQQKRRLVVTIFSTSLPSPSFFFFPPVRIGGWIRLDQKSSQRIPFVASAGMFLGIFFLFFFLSLLLFSPFSTPLVR